MCFLVRFHATFHIVIIKAPQTSRIFQKKNFTTNFLSFFFFCLFFFQFYPFPPKFQILPLPLVISLITMSTLGSIDFSVSSITLPTTSFKHWSLSSALGQILLWWALGPLSCPGICLVLYHWLDLDFNIVTLFFSLIFWFCLEKK